MRHFLILSFFVLFVCLTGTTEARKFALLVGVDEYDDVPSLKCCVNDVKVLKEALIKVGFEEDDIQILATRTNSYPTKKRIERKLREIFEMAGPHDMVFLSFSGHGAQEGKKVYFCPPDVDLEDLAGTCVSIDQVMQDLEKCQAQFKWVVVDACRNDPGDGSRSIGGKGLQVIPTPPAGIALFQSCAKGEQSWEDRESGNGYFTKNFAAALSGAADANLDGQLTLMEVCTWTTAQTKEQVMASQNKSQKPYFSGTVSDFTLTEDLNVPKAKALAEEAQKAMDAENYAMAIEKYDAALVLCPQFDSWKRQRDSAQKLLEKEHELQESVAFTYQLKPTSRDSFEYEKGILFGWDRTKIKKFVGKETNVVIPEGVKEIGDEAFKDCISLKTVIIPKGVTKIGSAAFLGCTSLKSVVIPQSVTYIGQFAFCGCSSLTSVTIPEGLEVISEGVFSGCSSLTSFSIPDSVKIINHPFANCHALNKWIISSDHPYFKSDGTGLLTKDGKWLVACLGTVKEYQIPKGVMHIGHWAFLGCRSLTSVVIPEGVIEIGDSAFKDCSSLTSIIIPESVKWIDSWSFSGCSSLTSIFISSNVTHIGTFDVFEDCPNLTIYAPNDSEAEKYAKQYKIPYKSK